METIAKQAAILAASAKVMQLQGKHSNQSRADLPGKTKESRDEQRRRQTECKRGFGIRRR
jgi:hypothetical protein